MKTLLLCLCLPALAVSQGIDHSSWDKILKAYVNDAGEVDYAALKKHQADLQSYMYRLASLSPRNHPEVFPSQNDKLAYWINAYNAFVTKGVVDRYPLKSVRDVGVLLSFFRDKDHYAGGERLSLHTVETDILRKMGDPRIHFAIVCASLSCPYLQHDAFTSVHVQDQLDRAARQFVNEPRNFSVDTYKGQVTLSSIFDWYAKDFIGGKSQLAILEWIRPMLNDANRATLDKVKNPVIKYREYDWSINDPGSRTRPKT